MKPLLLATLLSLPVLSFADSPWLKRLAICQAEMGGQIKNVLRLDDALYGPQKKNETIAKTLGTHSSATLGTHDGKAGLWVITQQKSYFVDMESLKHQARPLGQEWRLAINLPDNTILNMSFKYSSLKEDRTLLLTAASVGNAAKNHIPISAKEILSDGLRQQMETRLQDSLGELRKRFAPLSAENEMAQKKAQDLKDAVGDSRIVDENANRRTLPPSPQSARKAYQTNLVEKLHKCSEALKDSKEFASLNGMVILTRKYIERKINPPTPAIIEDGGAIREEQGI